MNKLIAYSLMLTAFILSGCAVTRVTPQDVDRVDQEIKGNRGIVRGDTSHLPEPKRKKTRRVYNVEIELYTPKDVAKPIDIQGNRGYIQRKEIPEKKVTLRRRPRLMVSEVEPVRPVKKKEGVTEMPKVVYQKPMEAEEKDKEEKKQKIYVVQKGDTLQKISDKMYGTTKKWKKIYEANKDVLEGPDLIRPGQKLVIPEE